MQFAELPAEAAAASQRRSRPRPDKREDADLAAARVSQGVRGPINWPNLRAPGQLPRAARSAVPSCPAAAVGPWQAGPLALLPTAEPRNHALTSPYELDVPLE
jgi:hypothetical protein